MSRTALVEVKNPNNREIWLPCRTCNKVTCHKALTEVNSTDESPDGDIRVWDHYYVVQCGGCKSLSFCRESTCSEDWNYNEDTGERELIPTVKVYPSCIAGRPLMQGSFVVPHGVHRIYKETHTALCEQQMVLAGIGIRAIVEAVCNEKKAAGSNLEKRIDSLVPMGLITPEGAKILHSLRFMGNSAAHEVTAHNQEELNIAFDVVEHLLNTVYVLPHSASRLPKKSVLVPPTPPTLSAVVALAPMPTTLIP